MKMIAIILVLIFLLCLSNSCSNVDKSLFDDIDEITIIWYPRPGFKLNDQSYSISLKYKGEIDYLIKIFNSLKQIMMAPKEALSEGRYEILINKNKSDQIKLRIASPNRIYLGSKIYKSEKLLLYLHAMVFDILMKNSTK